MRASRLLNLLVIVVLLWGLASCAMTPSGSAASDPIIPQLTTETGWWVDTTGTVPYETMWKLRSESDAAKSDGFQIGGVIFSNSLSEPIDICTKFGNNSGIGSAGKDNGLAVCVFKDKAGKDGKPPAISIAVGSGLEATVTDGRAGRFLDNYFIPQKNAGNWEQGVVDVTNALHRFLADPDNEEFKDPPMSTATLILIIVAIVLVVILIALDGKVNGFEITMGVAESMIGGGGLFGGGGASR